jgi:8-oxo-dGTP diphosphatase
MVEAIDPFDEIEAAHRLEVLAWVDRGDPLWRTTKPATPPEHLVAYAVLIDPDARSILLVDHRLAGKWLPTGGHIEPLEHPTEAAARELTEELGHRSTAACPRRPTDPADAHPRHQRRRDGGPRRHQPVVRVRRVDDGPAAARRR